MTEKEYKFLIQKRFVNQSFGSLISYWSKEERNVYHDIEEIRPILMKQLTDDYDIKNCVITIPVGTGYGVNYLWNNRSIVDSHCTHIVDLKYILHKMGMRYENGKTLKSDIQSNVAMLVIHNGVVYVDPVSANPLSPIHIKADIIKGKDIFFSGFILNRLKNG